MSELTTCLRIKPWFVVVVKLIVVIFVNLILARGINWIKVLLSVSSGSCHSFVIACACFYKSSVTRILLF